jgi:hypothetical protein
MEDYMPCPHCGGEHPDQTKYCPVTGQSLLSSGYCMRCGTKLEAGWKVCPNCGKPIQELPKDFRTDDKPQEPVQPRLRGLVNPQRKIAFGLVFIMGIFAIFSIAYLFLGTPPFTNTESEVPQPTDTQHEDHPAATANLEKEPTYVPLPTLSPPLASVEFPLEEIEYPYGWPAELQYPNEFALVGASSGSLDPDSPEGWAAKLRFRGGASSACDLLTSFFISKGWQINERTGLDSGGILVMVERNAGANEGILIIDPDPTDPANQNVLVLVFP